MALELDGLTVVAAGGAALFAPVSLTVEPGRIATVMAPSGAGKSTLLDAIGGHLAPGFAARGAVRLNGRDMLALPAEARRIGVLFQDALLFAHLSVGENLAFGLDRRVRGRPARRAAVEAALAAAGLEGFHDRDPAGLSGGQRTRAALMRTLLAAPDAVLLDEPFARLDAPLRAGLRRFVFDHIRDRAIPALLVSHDPADAEAAGGAVVDLSPRGG